MDKSNFRSLGHKHHSGVQDQILGTTPTDPSPTPLHFSQKDTHLKTTEVHKLLQKKAISLVPKACTKGFLPQYFWSPKKMFSKTSNIPTPAEPICSLGAFQDGEHPHSGELNPGGGLNDKNGSNRCLLLHSNPPRTSLVVTLPVTTTSVPVSVSPLWPILSTSAVHQSDTAHSGVVETTGNKNGCLHR